MTPEHIELIKATVPVLRENGVALTEYFYQRMLKQHPELKNTFNLDHQNSGMQPRALAAAVLAYAENIENPSVLAKAVERISNKHVSLNIQADQYAIVGEQLLLSISEVLDVAMDSELIAAWKAAYLQLANLLIAVEKAKYHDLANQTGGWVGWRAFTIQNIETHATGKIFTLSSSDQAEVVNAADNTYISVRVRIAQQDILQPQQFQVESENQHEYRITVQAEQQPSEFSVVNSLLHHYAVGDQVEVSAPMQL